MNTGYIQNYYGTSKGKTTAALGLSFRALGKGFKILWVMFTKGKIIEMPTFYGEINTIKQRCTIDEFRIEQYGIKTVLYKSKLGASTRKILEDGWEFAKENINNNNYDMIVLDELNVVIDLGVLDLNDVVNTIKNKPKQMEIVITGRPEIKELIEISDLVTEMKEIKHYFKNNVLARNGIEY